MIIKIYEMLIQTENQVASYSLGYFETPEKALIEYEKRMKEITDKADQYHSSRATNYYKPKIRILNKEVDEL